MSPSCDSPPQSVLAADSQPLFLIGLTYAIRQSPALRLAAATASGPEALALIQEHRPDVAVLDSRLRGLDAREIIHALRVDESSTRVLLLADHHTGEVILQSLTAGAIGVLSKFASPRAVQEAILAAGRGESVLPSEIGSSLAVELQQRGGGAQQPLSAREHEILELLSHGESSGTIAAHLSIGVPTVKSHIQSLYVKLGVNDRAAAVATGIRRGIIF